MGQRLGPHGQGQNDGGGGKKVLHVGVSFFGFS
jgi:hypothetical protein